MPLTAHLPAEDQASEKPSEDIGERIFRPGQDADGNFVLEELPLTLENLLHPREGDQVTQSNPHERLLTSLTDRLRRFLERRQGWGVFSDVLIRWGRPRVRNVSPDVSIVDGLADPEKVDNSLDVVAEGCRVRAVFEVVSTATKDLREKDEIHNLKLFARVGIEDCVHLYPRDHRKAGDPAVRVYSLKVVRQRSRYQVQRPDAEGRYLLRSLGLWLSVSDRGEVVLEDAATGERLLTSSEEESARRAAERQAADAEAAGLAKALVKILEGRGLQLTDDARRRFLDCRDARRFEGWLENALTVDSVDELS